MEKTIIIKSLFEKFKKSSQIEGKTSKSSIEKIEEGFHAGIAMVLEALREKVSELSEDDAMKTLSLMEMEVIDFFEGRCKKKAEQSIRNQGRVFDEAMLQIAGEKFEFLIGAIDCSGKGGDMGTYTLVKKTQEGFELVLANSHRDKEKYESEVKFLSEIFNARIVKSN